MSVDYAFYTSIRSEDVLADHFGSELDLRPGSEDRPVPLVSDALWVSIRVDLDEDWEEEAELLGSEHLSMVTFVPSKSLSWPDETRVLSNVVRAVIALWEAHPDSTGVLAVYEQLMLQRLTDAAIVLDQTITGTSDEGFNTAHAFDDLLELVELRDIRTDL